MAPRLVPHIPTDLLDYLEALFKDSCPSFEATVDQIRFKQGQVSVVRHLREHHRKQQDNILIVQS